MFEQIAMEAVAMLVIIFLISIAFIMAYAWFIRGEVEPSKRFKASPFEKPKRYISSQRPRLLEYLKQKEENSSQ